MFNALDAQKVFDNHREMIIEALRAAYLGGFYGPLDLIDSTVEKLFADLIDKFPSAKSCPVVERRSSLHRSPHPQMVSASFPQSLIRSATFEPIRRLSDVAIIPFDSISDSNNFSEHTSNEVTDIEFENSNMEQEDIFRISSSNEIWNDTF